MSVNTYGLGSVSAVKTAKGIRYRAKVPNGAGGHKSAGRYDTEDLAWAALRGFAEERAKGGLVLGGDTLRAFGEAFLARRESNGGRNGKTDKSRWNLHILAAPFADWPLKAITPRAVAEWIDSLSSKAAADRRSSRSLGPQTIRHCVALLRRALQLAMNRGLVTVNAAAGHELPAINNDDEWTYLTPEEQERLCACPSIPLAERLAIAFALGTGLRQGEQWCLELKDVHAGEDEEHPHVIVRWGKPGKPPKNGKIRRVELFGRALGAARTWLAILPGWAKSNPLGLLWPTQRGKRRRDGKPPRGWDRATRAGELSYLEAAGLLPEQRHDGRKMYWHALRHTCAASLVSGWWGRRWSLIEVRDHLGHTSIEVTQRYAHLGHGVLVDAARGTGAEPALNLPASPTPPSAKPLVLPSAPQRIRTSGLRLRRPTTSLEIVGNQSDFEPARAGCGQVEEAARVATLCQGALEAVAAGEPTAVRRLIDACAQARDFADGLVSEALPAGVVDLAEERARRSQGGR